MYVGASRVRNKLPSIFISAALEKRRNRYVRVAASNNIETCCGRKNENGLHQWGCKHTRWRHNLFIKSFLVNIIYPIISHFEKWSYQIKKERYF